MYPGPPPPAVAALRLFRAHACAPFFFRTYRPPPAARPAKKKEKTPPTHGEEGDFFERRRQPIPPPAPRLFQNVSCGIDATCTWPASGPGNRPPRMHNTAEFDVGLGRLSKVTLGPKHAAIRGLDEDDRPTDRNEQSGTGNFCFRIV
jgi:hypothetical protein